MEMGEDNIIRCSYRLQVTGIAFQKNCYLKPVIFVINF